MMDRKQNQQWLHEAGERFPARMGTNGFGWAFTSQGWKGFTIIHSFTGAGGDGRVPFAGVRQGKDSAWLGTTDEGGTYGSGTVYRFNSDGTGYRVLHEFGGKLKWDGGKPRGTLCEASAGLTE